MTQTTEPPVGTEEQLKEAIDVLTSTLVKARGPADSVALLQELLSDEVDDVIVDNCPAMGCCGCGAWMADVRTPGWTGAPGGESYCWSCVDSPDHEITQYTAFAGRER